MLHKLNDHFDFPLSGKYKMAPWILQRLTFSSLQSSLLDNNIKVNLLLHSLSNCKSQKIPKLEIHGDIELRSGKEKNCWCLLMKR